MPITLKPNQAKYKTSEGYQTLNVLADETTQQKINQINQIADQRIEQIEQMTDAVVYDIKIDGTSVVNNHIANITGLAKNSDVTELANKLDDVDTQLDQVREDLSNLPTEETAQKMLDEEEVNKVMTEQMLDVIGYWLTDGLPTDEIGQEIIYRMNEQHRLLDELFTELTEREGA